MTDPKTDPHSDPKSNHLIDLKQQKIPNPKPTPDPRQQLWDPKDGSQEV